VGKVEGIPKPYQKRDISNPTKYEFCRLSSEKLRKAKGKKRRASYHPVKPGKKGGGSTKKRKAVRIDWLSKKKREEVTNRIAILPREGKGNKGRIMGRKKDDRV